MRRRIAVTTAAAAAIALVSLGASPAAAAELPEGAELYGFTYETFFAMGSDGALTEVSTLPNVDDGKFGADFDSTTGLGYYFADGEPCVLFSIDVETGISTEIGPVGEDVPQFTQCDALNVDRDGTLRIASQHGVMLTVDKSTGATLSVVQVDLEDYLSAILQAPDGSFYATTYYDGLFALDVATGSLAPIASGLNGYESAVIDDAGTVWASAPGGCSYGLWSLPISDPMSVTFEGSFLNGDICEGVYALLVTGAVVPPAPAPQLAATGTGSAAQSLAPFAALALLAGGGALLLARRTRIA
jgi:hypothetical protein